MAYLPTLCEVNYDKSEWWEDTPIPYRYRSLSAKSKDGPQIPPRELASAASFYESQSYFRTDSACNMEPRRPPTVFSTYSNQGLPPSRACTLPPSYYNTEYPANSDLYVPRANREGRAWTAPTAKSLPNLPSRSNSIMFPPGGGPMGEPREEKKEALKWVPALNTWVVDKNQNPVPYLTFVNSMNLRDRDPSEYQVTEEEVSLVSGSQPCGRFLSHMHMQQDATKVIFAQKQAQMIRKRRLHHDREEKALTSRSQPTVRPKSPTRVRFEKTPSPPPPPPAVPEPIKPSLPTAPPVVPSVPTPVPTIPEEPTPPRVFSPPPPRRLPTPVDTLFVSYDPTEDLVEGVRDATLKEDTAPLKQASPPPPSPKTPTPPPKEPSPTPPPPKQPTPLPIEDIEILSASPPTSSTPSPRFLAPIRKEPPPPPRTALKHRSKAEKHKPHKVKPPPKPKHKKKARSEKRPQPGKNKSKDAPQTIVVNDAPNLVLTVHATDQMGDESDPRSPRSEPIFDDARSFSPALSSPCSLPLPPLSPPLDDPPPPPLCYDEDLPPVVIRPITSRPLSAFSSANSSDFGDDSSTGSPSSIGRKREKRVRWRAAKPKKEEELTPPPEPKIPNFPKRRVSDWVWSDDDDDFTMPPTPTSFRERGDNSSLDAVPSPSPSPPPPPKAPTPPVEKPKPIPKPKTKTKKKFGPKKLDKSLQEQMERERLAEERKQKLMGLHRRKSVVQKDAGGKDNRGPKFEDYGFLAKYCIFSKEKYEMYRRIFENVDEEGRGWLPGEEVMVALRVVNKSLTVSEERYLTRILEMTGYKPSDGADLKLFAVLAAFSQRITELDEWLRMAIASIDMQRLDMKMYMCKALWEYSVDPDTRLMPIDHLCVELRAGGVSAEHEQEVRDKLRHMNALDLLDFLAYIPLFIMIHESVVTNPLDTTRDK